MSSQTTNLHLVKPDFNETVDVSTINRNMELIDEGVGASVKNITRSGTTFTVTRTDGTTFTFTQQDTSYPTAITNITRNGTTFTATRADGTTFTFTQQDNNTTYSQISRGSGAGLAPGLPSGNGTTRYLREDGSWQVPPNSVYSLPLAANGTRGGIQLGYSTNGKNYAVQQSGEKAYVNVPWTDTNTNTWRGIQNNLTSTSTTDSLSAAQGKVLNDKLGISRIAFGAAGIDFTNGVGVYNNSEITGSSSVMAFPQTGGLTSLTLNGTPEAGKFTMWAYVTEFGQAFSGRLYIRFIIVR